MNPRLGLLLLLLVFSLRAVDPLEMSTSVDRSRLGVEDQLMLTVTFKGIGNPPQPDLSVIRDFDVVPGIVHQGTEFVMNQSGTTILTRFIFQLHPKRTGSLVIPPVKARVNGQILESRALKVEVVPGRLTKPQPKQPVRRLPSFFDDPMEELFNTAPQVKDPEMFVRTRPSRTRLIEGEALLVKIELLTRDPVVERRMLRADSVPGFWTEWLEPQSPVVESKEMVDGKNYTVVEIDRGIFIPQMPGQREIPAFEYGFIANLGSGRSLFPQHQQVIRKTAPVMLDVQPLPPEARGLSVGQYTMTATAKPLQLDVNDLLTLTLIISGPGNVKTLNPPVLPSLEGAKAFPAKISRNSRVGDGPLMAELTAEIPISFNRAGSLTIPALSLTYFNPDTKAVETAASDPLTVTVTGQPEARVVNRPLEPESVTRTGEDIEYLLNGSVEDPRQSWVFSSWFPTLLMLPFLMPLGFLFYRHLYRPLIRKWGKGGKSARLQGMLKTLRGVDGAENLLGPLDAFLMESLGLRPSELNRSAIETRLQDARLPEAAVGRLLELRDNLLGLRFAGGHWSDEAWMKVRKETIDLLEGLIRGRR